MFEYRNGKIIFQADEVSDTAGTLFYDGQVLDFESSDYFSFNEQMGNAFDPNRSEITFADKVYNICTDIFETIKKMQNERIERRYCSLLAARLYETFAGFWKRKLLMRNFDLIGVKYWRKVLEITKDWQKNNSNIFIHTGTPYYFLSENYFMVGDLDSAFVYLHNALKIDQQTWQWAYPGHIGAYSLAKLIDDRRTQMNYLTKDLRNELIKFITKFNANYKTLSIEDFDRKFLKNENAFQILGYFFTFTFHTIIHNQRNMLLEIPENYFLKIRSLDIIFNLCLIIDKILMNVFLSNETDLKKKTISYGIVELCKHNGWTNSYKIWKKWLKQGVVDEYDADKNIRVLLCKTKKCDGNIVEKEVFILLLAYYLRNYGAHNLNEESIVIEKYEEIIEELLMAFFFSVESINA